MPKTGAVTAPARTDSETVAVAGFSAVMKQDKVTKNAVRYQEWHENDTIPDKIGQLYLQKSAFPNGAPQSITVHVAALEG